MITSEVVAEEGVAWWWGDAVKEVTAVLFINNFLIPNDFPTPLVGPLDSYA